MFAFPLWGRFLNGRNFPEARQSRKAACRIAHQPRSWPVMGGFLPSISFRYQQFLGRYFYRGTWVANLISLPFTTSLRQCRLTTQARSLRSSTANVRC